LNDLERERHIRGAWNSWHVALDRWVTFEPVVTIVVSRRQCFRVVGDLATLYDTKSGWNRPYGTKFDDWSHAGSMGLNVPMRGANRLPNTV
jgi:hypothetical protein